MILTNSKGKKPTVCNKKPSKIIVDAILCYAKAQAQMSLLNVPSDESDDSDERNT